MVHVLQLSFFIRCFQCCFSFVFFAACIVIIVTPGFFEILLKCFNVILFPLFQTVRWFSLNVFDLKGFSALWLLPHILHSSIGLIQCVITLSCNFAIALRCFPCQRYFLLFRTAEGFSSPCLMFDFIVCFGTDFVFAFFFGGGMQCIYFAFVVALCRRLVCICIEIFHSRSNSK